MTQLRSCSWMNVKIQTSFQIKIAYWMGRGGAEQRSLMKARSGWGTFLKTKEFLWKTKSGSLRCGCTLADRKAWCHTHQVSLSCRDAPGIVTSHLSKSHTTVLYHTCLYMVIAKRRVWYPPRTDWGEVGGQGSVGRQKKSRSKKRKKVRQRCTKECWWQIK